MRQDRPRACDASARWVGIQPREEMVSNVIRVSGHEGACPGGHRPQRDCPVPPLVARAGPGVTRARTQARVPRIEDANFGDCKSVGGGVLDARLMVGPGFRIYFGRWRRGGPDSSVAAKHHRWGTSAAGRAYWREYQGGK